MEKENNSNSKTVCCSGPSNSTSASTAVDALPTYRYFPPTLRICGIDVKLVVSDPADWAEGGMGRANQITNTITLRPNLDISVEGGVLIHEVIHIISDMNELKAIKDDEPTIAVLANALNAFLKDNWVKLNKYWNE